MARHRALEHEGVAGRQRKGALGFLERMGEFGAMLDVYQGFIVTYEHPR
jgi:hypothetical protein